MHKEIQFMIRSSTPPKVELSDAGLYVRFMDDVQVARTVIQNEWPHVAVDLDAHDRVIGIEAVPAPQEFTIGMIRQIAQNAGVGGLPHYKPEDVRIENLCAA
jgi:hypothetical protein